MQTPQDILPKSGAVPEQSYGAFLRRAQELAEPLIALMEDGQTALPLQGPASNHGDDADRLESFARPTLLLALWLHGLGKAGPIDDMTAKKADRASGWIRTALIAGIDPHHPGYWNDLTNRHQHAVEMAILCMALEIGRERIWDPIPERDKTSVLRWLSRIRGHAGHRNNHYFFDVLTLEFLNANGADEPEDGALLAHLLDELEAMRRTDGWFIDGCNESYDHYNAYAFHIYGLYWAWKHGSRDPDRADRWKDFGTQFVPQYERLFARSGEPVPIGRSLTYRFNGIGVFPLAALHDLPGIDHSRTGRASAACIDFFLNASCEQTQGCLSVGWTDPFQPVAEPYSCAGSPYWAAKGLLMLLLEPDHIFFNAERSVGIPEPRSPLQIRSPGWLVRDTDGPMPDTEIICAGVAASPGAATRFGPWKWGKTAYRTGFGYLTSPSENHFPIDAAITAEDPTTGCIFGRNDAVPIALRPNGVDYVSALGDAPSKFMVNIRAAIFIERDWRIEVYKLWANRKTIIRIGTHAIGADQPGDLTLESHSARNRITNQIVACQPLIGIDTVCSYTRQEGEDRKHLTHEHHAVLSGEATLETTPQLLAIATFAGTNPPPPMRCVNHEGDSLVLSIGDRPTTITHHLLCVDSGSISTKHRPTHV